jgi:ABC-type spermidine/putrescine transport system permease subunit II
MMRRRTSGSLAGMITGATLIFLYAPLAIVVLFSFHETASLSLPFTGFSLRWYRQVLGSPQFRSALTNSLIVASSVACVTLVIGTMAAAALSRASSKIRTPVAFLFFLPITIPGLFLGISLLVFFVRVHIHLSLVTVAIAHTVYVFPYFFLMARVALDRLDPALEEAGTDLGAGGWKVFRHVTLPQIWPVLLGATLLAFALSFDEFLITFFVVGPDSTLPLYVWSSLRRTVTPAINTVSTVLMGLTLAMWVGAFALIRIRGLRMPADAAPLAVPS